MNHLYISDPISNIQDQLAAESTNKYQYRYRERLKNQNKLLHWFTLNVRWKRQTAREELLFTDRLTFHGSFRGWGRRYVTEGGGGGARGARRNELFSVYRKVTLRYCVPLWLFKCVYRIWCGRNVEYFPENSLIKIWIPYSYTSFVIRSRFVAENLFSTFNSVSTFHSLHIIFNAVTSWHCSNLRLMKSVRSREVMQQFQFSLTCVGYAADTII